MTACRIAYVEASRGTRAVGSGTSPVHRPVLRTVDRRRRPWVRTGGRAEQPRPSCFLFDEQEA